MRSQRNTVCSRTSRTAAAAAVNGRGRRTRHRRQRLRISAGGLLLLFLGGGGGGGGSGAAQRARLQSNAPRRRCRCLLLGGRSGGAGRLRCGRRGCCCGGGAGRARRPQRGGARARQRWKSAREQSGRTTIERVAEAASACSAPFAGPFFMADEAYGPSAHHKQHASQGSTQHKRQRARRSQKGVPCGA